MILAIICGLLGTWAGADGTSKAWRRFGIPLSITIYLLYKTADPLSLISLLLSVPLSIGYGIFDASDEGSTLCQWWHKIIKCPQTLVIAVRATIACLMLVCMLNVPFMLGCWNKYVIGSVIYMIVSVFFGAIYGNEGTFKLFGKVLLWEEFIIAFTLGGVIALMTY